MIKINDATISVSGNVLFEDLNLEIKSNEITGIIAPSGTGKTTIFNCMLGLHELDKGSILYDQSKLTNKKMYDSITYMPQEAGLYTGLTGKQNLEFFAKLKKVKLSKSDVINLFKEYDLEYALNRSVIKYSGGEKKKLSLMISLLGENKYIFLDEPTVGIDPVQKEEFWKRIRKLVKVDVSVIVTTHVMEEASRCDTIMFLRQGKLLITDNEQNILRKLDVENLNEAFIKLATGGNDEYNSDSL